jgi:hypothetical protein
MMTLLDRTKRIFLKGLLGLTSWRSENTKRNGKIALMLKNKASYSAIQDATGCTRHDRKDRQAASRCSVMSWGAGRLPA